MAIIRSGRFEFGSVPPSLYRLIVRDPQNALCVANMPLTVINAKRSKARSQVIHMRPAGVDDCSYGDFK